MLFLKEILYRKFNFLLGALGMVAAVALVVLFVTMTKASQNETRILTRDMGFNLRIIPAQTDMNDFWVSGYSHRTMDQQYVSRLVTTNSVFYAHITASLHKKIQWRNTETILTGISPEEKEPSGKTKSKMIFAISPKKVFVGYELAKSQNIHLGDTLNILGRSFQVERTLSETGSNDDIRIYFDLTALQQLLKMEGRINEIMALNCLCSTKGDDPLGALRQQLEKVLPNTKVIMNKTIAVARERQRKMMDKYFLVLLPLFLFGCAIWVGIITMINVLQRKGEIGIMMALGFKRWRISRLFFARALALGIVGALLGFALGTWLAHAYGPSVFKVAARSIRPMYVLQYWTLLLAPVFAVISSFIPVMWAIGQQPAEILKQE